MTSTLGSILAATGWTGLYVGLVVAAASAVFATGVPRQGCYPDCVNGVDPTLALAGLALLVVGLGLATVGGRLANRR